MGPGRRCQVHSVHQGTSDYVLNQKSEDAEMIHLHGRCQLHVLQSCFVNRAVVLQKGCHNLARLVQDKKKGRRKTKQISVALLVVPETSHPKTWLEKMVLQSNL